MALKDWPYAGFPGTAINPKSLLAEVVDDEQVAAALLASQNPGDQVFVFLAQGRISDAAEAVAEARLRDPDSLLLQMLDADVLRAGKQPRQAEERLRSLLVAVARTPAEPGVHQLLGKVYFSSGNYPAAVKSFSLALEQRVAAGANAEAIYASTVALRRSKDLAEQ